MAYNEYLKLNNVTLPFPETYDMTLSNVEASTNGETEAGTIQRDVIRMGLVTISVTFLLSASWVKRMTEFSKINKLNVEYFDTSELELKSTEMYMSDYSVKLVKDTSKKGLWTVSFTLNEF